MLNAKYKKEAMKKCEEAADSYKREYTHTVKHAGELYEHKNNASSLLLDVDQYIQSLSDKPKEIVALASEVTVARKKFENEVEQLKIEVKNADITGKGIAGGGLLAGAGVAAFGPSAMMGIATTFGTASTGTAIITLSGAAQTSAAMAWIGGGFLAAEGATGTVALGETFLTMAGPVGWAIGGTALVGGAIMATSKNKKMAEKAEEKTREIKTATVQLKDMKTKILAESTVIVEMRKGIKKTLKDLQAIGKNDYHSFEEEEQSMLMELVNSSRALSSRIGVKL